MRQIDVAERRRRLAVRHALHPAHRAGGAAQVARRLFALHATDPATVFLSVRARTAGPDQPADIEDTLYQRRELVRMLGMRRTLFVVPRQSVPLVQASTLPPIAARLRTGLITHLGQAGVTTEPAAWLADVEQAVLAALAGLGGSATAAELAAAEPRLRTTLLMAAGKPYEARQAITSRVLGLLAADGHLVRGRPTGSWLSQQYNWWLAETWLGPGGTDPIPPAEARAEVARQWLAAFGPARLADLKWWTGWTMAQAKQAAAGTGAVEVDLDEGPGLALAGDLESTPDPGPWAALLPALDCTIMGWQDRGWFIGPDQAAHFDQNGNAGPTIWLNGQVVGAWVQRGDGEIAIALLTDVGSEGRELIAAECAAVAAWLGPVRVIPRFHTPAERGLSKSPPAPLP